jgi:hypothetical protein
MSSRERTINRWHERRLASTRQTAMTIRCLRRANATRVSSLLLATSHGSTTGVSCRASHTTSSIARPYTFHFGVAWAGKTTDTSERELFVPFPPDSPIGVWRDQNLSRWQRTNLAAWRPKNLKTPGEDFFYVQEVRFSLSLSFFST